MELDLTRVNDVVTLMKSSKSEEEWNDNCDKVKATNGGDYPDFWFYSIILSGVLNSVSSTWR